jgi:hypothetical protein
MKRLALVIGFSLIFAVGLYAGESRAVYRVLRFSPYQVGIYCTNGGDPTVLGNPSGKVLEISCGN